MLQAAPRVVLRLTQENNAPPEVKTIQKTLHQISVSILHKMHRNAVYCDRRSSSQEKRRHKICLTQVNYQNDRKIHYRLENFSLRHDAYTHLTSFFVMESHHNNVQNRITY